MKKIKKLLQKLSKKKGIVIAVALVLVIVIALIVRSCGSDDASSTELTGSVDTVQVRSIANSITGNGTVATAAYEDISADVSGLEVKEVLVEEGQVIEAGQVIAVLDTTPLQEDIADVNEDIADTRESQAKQDSNYDNQMAEKFKSRDDTINTNYNNMVKTADELETAKKDLETAQADYDAAKKKYDDYEAEKYKETDTTAQGANNSESSTSGNSITSSIGNNGNSSSGYDWTESDLKSKMDSAKSTLTSAQTKVDTLNKQLETYYDNMVNAYNDESVYGILDNKNDYDKNADETVESYQERIDDYNEQIGNAHLISSISGVITALNVAVGDTYNGGTAATVKNLDGFVIEAQIDEYDIADVQLGQNVLIKTDATRDDELWGVVTYVALTTDQTGSVGSSSSLDISSMLGGSSSSSALSSLTGSSSSDSATYLVKITLNDMDERLRIGMNARVSVLTEEADDVLSVPYDALQSDEDGNIYVNVITSAEDVDVSSADFTYEQVNVTVGTQGTYYVEITGSGISEGTRIFIPANSSGSSITDMLTHMGSDAGV